MSIGRGAGRSLWAHSMFRCFIMACYNLERFRDFVFKSPFLKKFDVNPDIVASIRDDDVNLLEFAFQWLKFALFGEPTLTVRDQVTEKLTAEEA
jgi:hypothetical protein